MDMSILELVEGAREAKGLAIVIDVLRAFSTTCFMMDAGAEEIVLVDTIEGAIRMKDSANVLLAGERGGKMPEGFDLSNSPFEIQGKDLSGKTIVLTTSAGTRAVLNAADAEKILLCSFVNVGATIRYIRESNPAQVSIVAAGFNGVERAEEDMLCAEYMRSSLKGTPMDFSAIKEMIRNAPSTQRFFDRRRHWEHKEDVELCLDKDRFDFVLEASIKEKKAYIRRLRCEDGD